MKKYFQFPVPEHNAIPFFEKLTDNLLHMPGESTAVPLSELLINKKILIVDDDVASLMLCKEFFSELGALADIVQSGQEAVEKLRQFSPPDIIFMDIRMPFMNGYQAKDEIRKINSGIPVVALTAFALGSDRDQALASGFDDFIAKPVNFYELWNLLIRHLDFVEK